MFQKAILMEDANEREIATLKDRNAVLGLENKSLHNKLNSQTEQSNAFHFQILASIFYTYA